MRLQTQSQTLVQGQGAHYRGPLDCFLRMLRTEGLRALYKGATPALSSQLLENSALFAANGIIRRAWEQMQGGALSLPQSAVAGGMSGVFSVMAMCPAEVVKCRLQAQRAEHAGSAGGAVRASHPRYAGPVDCLRQTLRHEGPRGLYRGVGALWGRDIPYNYIYFGTYETCTWLAMRLTQSESRSELNAGLVLLSGGSAGMTAWGVMFPLDLIKSRMQAATTHMTMASCVRLVLQRDGVAGLYRGWSAAVLRAFPANGALFLGYELMQRMWELQLGPRWAPS